MLAYGGARRRLPRRHPSGRRPAARGPIVQRDARRGIVVRGFVRLARATPRPMSAAAVDGSTRRIAVESAAAAVVSAGSGPAFQWSRATSNQTASERRSPASETPVRRSSTNPRSKASAPIQRSTTAGSRICPAASRSHNSRAWNTAKPVAARIASVRAMSHAPPATPRRASTIDASRPEADTTRENGGPIAVTILVEPVLCKRETKPQPAQQ
jgi:hypothetical protein